MSRRYVGPKLWLDRKRDTWTILDGPLRIRTGVPGCARSKALLAIEQYSDGTYRHDAPVRPSPKRESLPRKGVYVIGFGPYVKIGITSNLELRISQLQTPEPIKVYSLLNGWASLERELHDRFSHLRLQGEWFKKDGELLEWIIDGCVLSERKTRPAGKLSGV